MRINRKFSLLVQWQSICFASNLPEKRQNLSSSICKLSYLQLPQVVCLEFAVLCTVVYLLTVETMWHIPSRNIKCTDADSIFFNQKFITYLKVLKFIRLIQNDSSLDLKQQKTFILETGYLYNINSDILYLCAINEI